ncbi:MAG: hypothetical protein ACFE7E_04675 [Candidatus Hodarchaeota archaeon]
MMLGRRTKLLLSALILISMLSSIPVSRQQSQWTEPTKIISDYSRSISLDRAICIDSLGSVHITCFDAGTGAILYVYNNSGRFASTEVGVGIFPAIAIDSSNKIHIAYVGLDYSLDNDFELFYTNNLNGSFLPPQNLTENSITDSLPDIAIDPSDNVHIIYEANLTNIGIFYLNDTGGFSGVPIRITNESYLEELHPTIAANSSIVYVVYSGNTTTDVSDILHTNSSLGFFPNSTRINSPNETNAIPSIAIDPSGVIHLVYEGVGSGTNYVFYVNNSDGFFGTPIVVASGDVGSPSVAADSSGYIHIAYVGWDGQDFEIYYVNGTSGSFVTPTAITDNIGEQDLHPSIVVDEFGYVHVVYVKGVFIPLVGAVRGEVFYVTTSPYPPTGITEGFPLIMIIMIAVIVIIIAAGIGLTLWKRRPKEDALIGGWTKKD